MATSFSPRRFLAAQVVERLILAVVQTLILLGVAPVFKGVGRGLAPELLCGDDPRLGRVPLPRLRVAGWATTENQVAPLTQIVTPRSSSCRACSSRPTGARGGAPADQPPAASRSRRRPRDQHDRRDALGRSARCWSPGLSAIGFARGAFPLRELSVGRRTVAFALGAEPRLLVVVRSAVPAPLRVRGYPNAVLVAILPFEVRSDGSRSRSRRGRRSAHARERAVHAVRHRPEAAPDAQRRRRSRRASRRR